MLELPHGSLRYKTRNLGGRYPQLRVQIREHDAFRARSCEVLKRSDGGNQL